MVYQEITRVLPDGRDPVSTQCPGFGLISDSFSGQTFEDFDSFVRVRNCLYEAMRIYRKSSYGYSAE